MSWYTFVVTPSVHGPIVAENIRELARDPLARAALPLDAEVYRRRLENGERFFFSPSTTCIFRPFIETYGGVECEAPFQGTDIPADLLKLDLALGATWRPTAPPSMHGSA
jgi:hypothetical protein